MYNWKVDLTIAIVAFLAMIFFIATEASAARVMIIEDNSVSYFHEQSQANCEHYLVKLEAAYRHDPWQSSVTTLIDGSVRLIAASDDAITTYSCISHKE